MQKISLKRVNLVLRWRRSRAECKINDSKRELGWDRDWYCDEALVEGFGAIFAEVFFQEGQFGVEVAKKIVKCGCRPRESNTTCLMVMVERNQVLVNECSCRDRSRL